MGRQSLQTVRHSEEERIDGVILCMSLRRSVSAPELLAVSVYPCCLLSEFTCVTVSDIISQVVAEQHKQQSNPFVAIWKDFYHTSLCYNLTLNVCQLIFLLHLYSLSIYSNHITLIIIIIIIIRMLLLVNN